MKEGDWRLVAVRGATTVEADDADQIRERTAELLEAVMERNQIGPDDMVSIIFTATTDLQAEFPAVAARDLGLLQVPLLCSQEIPVAGSMQRCIRLLLHAYSAKPREEIRHIYLHGTQQLRTDLPDD